VFPEPFRVLAEAQNPLFHGVLQAQKTGEATKARAH